MERCPRWALELLRGTTAAGLIVGGAPAVAQTVSYALPEPGAYPCLITTLRPTMRFNVITRQMEPWSELAFAPSALGTLVLEPGGRYRLAPSGERGTYTARPTGAVAFGGYLGGPQFTSGYSAKDGNFEITIVHRSEPNATALTSSCSRRSAAAQMTVTGQPNPGLPGRLVFAHEGRVYEVAVERGRVSPLADGTLPYAARNGELMYLNGAGQIVVAAPDGRTGARFDAEASNNGLPVGANADFPVRREDLALAPDGSAVVYSAWDAVKKYRVVVRTRAGRELASFTGYTSADFTPDGRVILVGYPKEGGPSGVYVSDAGFRTLRRLDPDLDTPNCPAVSPDGRRVAFVQGGKLWVMNADGSGARTLPTTNGKLTSVAVHGWPAWSPDGRWIALTADLDGFSANGTEILVASADGDAGKLQWVGNQKLEYVHTSGDRLTWR